MARINKRLKIEALNYMLKALNNPPRQINGYTYGLCHIMADFQDSIGLYRKENNLDKWFLGLLPEYNERNEERHGGYAWKANNPKPRIKWVNEQLKIVKSKWW